MERETNNPEPGIKEYGRDQLSEGDTVRYRGKLHRVVKHDTGYTIREFYSHSTPEKGPGPGWDSRWRVLEHYGVSEPNELPDQPYVTFELEPIEDVQ